MAIVHECPSCGKKLKIPDELVGKQVRCSDCAGTFVAEKALPPAPPRPSRAGRRDDDDYEVDRPIRRSHREPDSNFEPHRGGLVMAFGIIALVLVLLSGGVYIGGAAAGPVALGGIPVTIIGLVLGILAWMWGGSDLSRMKAGYMDPTGHGMTQAGYICGIIGTILNAIALVGACVATVAILAFGVALFSCCMLGAASTTPPGPRPSPPPPRRFDVPSQPRLSDYLPDRRL